MEDAGSLPGSIREAHWGRGGFQLRVGPRPWTGCQLRSKSEGEGKEEIGKMFQPQGHLSGSSGSVFKLEYEDAT